MGYTIEHRGRRPNVVVHSTGQFLNSTWIRGTALWGKKKCTREVACILVERGYSVCRGTVRGSCQWLG